MVYAGVNLSLNWARGWEEGARYLPISVCCFVCRFVFLSGGGSRGGGAADLVMRHYHWGHLKRSMRAVRAQCNYLGVWP